MDFANLAAKLAPLPTSLARASESTDRGDSASVRENGAEYVNELLIN